MGGSIVNWTVRQVTMRDRWVGVLSTGRSDESDQIMGLSLFLIEKRSQIVYVKTVFGKIGSNSCCAFLVHVLVCAN